MAKKKTTTKTTTIRITKGTKANLEALWLEKKDTCEIILKRLLCLHGLVKDNPALIKEARRRAEAEKPH